MLITAHPRSHREAGWTCGHSLSMTSASLHGDDWMSATQSGDPGDRQNVEDFQADESCTTFVAHQAVVPEASLLPLYPLYIVCLFWSLK